MPGRPRPARLRIMQRLLLATGNPGKVREFRRLLQATPFAVVSATEVGVELEVIEDGATYAENAAKKVLAFAAAGRCLALADDSGIEVDALGGGPGMYSARYGGPGLDDAGRVQLLLRELAGVPPELRTARYRAVVAIAAPGTSVALFEETWEGRIAFATRGCRGFGYDPVFELADGRVSAELSDEEKDAVSHRGKAVRAAAAYLAAGLRE